MDNVRLENVQVLGANLSNVLNAFGSFQLLASRIMLEEGLGAESKEGVVQFDKDRWYPVTRWLATFERIGREYGESMLGQVGLAVPKNAIFPPFVTDIDSALKSVDIAYHMNHALEGRPMFSPATGTMTEGIGHYGYSRVPGKKQIICECNNPYPCPFDLHLLQAMAQRFEVTATVAHDTTKPCRKQGGPSCTYIVKWV
ncbi:hypothetical protein ATI61_110155 [Archangium gephyra]|uniref:4-vinyl reductase 4VR domain-containing protein n=1 Tax=Archangium gephyra TaxID=48 RepID=A0AAC8QEZ7_9BACT|nr:Hypothetical protein AA314_07724 [Archangium gephyra]REG27148.1 hypothetical protein ATI61_110155 [Archangium gephyra]